MKPALSAEEWLCRHTRRDGCEFWISHDGGEVVLDRSRPGVTTPEDRHALAAFCLDGQPFGFTREDAELVRIASGEVSDRYRRLQGLAERIEALLPPEAL